MEHISAIVVSYRTPKLTLAAVESALGAGDVTEVVVVDNDSRDETSKLLHDLKDPRVRIIVNTTNRGYGAAANQGAASASGPILLFLNSDALLTSHAVRALSEALAVHRGRAMIGARVIDPAGVVQSSAGLLPGPLDLAIRALDIHRLALAGSRLPIVGAAVARSRIAAEYASAVRATSTFETSMVTGACFAIGSEAFRETGGFDERFFLYFEDADLCRRVSAAGMPIKYVPEAAVVHIGGASSSEDYHFGPPHARAMRQYLAKWYGARGSMYALALLWLRAAGLTVMVRPAAPRAWRALWAAARHEDPRC